MTRPNNTMLPFTTTIILLALVATVNAGAVTTWKDRMARRAHEIRLLQATDMGEPVGVHAVLRCFDLV